MTGDPILAAPTGQSVVSPSVQDLTTKRAVSILGPDGNTEATTKADPKERWRDVRTRGVREGEKPSPGSGDAVEDEVSQAVALSGRGIEKVLASSAVLKWYALLTC